MKDKIIDIPKFNQERNSNDKYGLCHGAFDLVHPGHIKHFESASKSCDKLIVSLTSDNFVKKRKGQNRPIYTQDERAYIISCIEFVDFVVISPYETAIEIIQELKPNIYIKGPDYKNKQTAGILAEKKAVEDIGGELLFTDDEKYSTSDLIDKISAISRPKMLLILDRDGTLIEEKTFLGKNKDWKSNIILIRETVDFIHYLKQYFNLTIIVLSNQAGIARGYFPPSIVEQINYIIDNQLKNEGIKIASWKYCPDIDINYAKQQGLSNFIPEYIKDITKRKPSPQLLFDAMSEIGTHLSRFKKLLVLGDRHEDEDLAKNIKANFINVSRKSYNDILDEYKKIFVSS